MDSLLGELSRYWLEGTSRAVEGISRGLRDPYPIHDEPAGATPYEVVHKGEKLRLRYYRAKGGERRFAPIVLVYALVKRPFILDLLPGRSVIENLTGQGFDIYLTDWIPPTREDSWRGFDDYVNCELYDAMGAVQRHSGEDRVNLMGYCFGGLLSVIWTALYPQTVRNLVTLATPVDSSEGGDNPLFGVARLISDQIADSIVGTYGNCPGWLINACFKGMAPMHHAMAKYLELYKNRSSGYAQFFGLFERWMDSDVPMAGEVFRELTEQLFRHNRLVRSEFQVGAARAELKEIECPLLNVIGEHDDVVPMRASLPLGESVASRDWSNLIFPAGHVGTTVSSAAQRKLWPEVGRWLAQRN